MAKPKLAVVSDEDLAGSGQGEVIGVNQPPADPVPHEKPQAMDLSAEDDGRDFKLHSNDYL